MTSSTMTIDADHAKYAVGHTPEVVVLVWRHAAAMEAIATLATTFDEMRIARPGARFGFLSIIEESCSLDMPLDVRGGLSSVLGQNQDTIASAAIVFEGRGFRATLVRSVITAINLATGTKFPNAVFSDLANAADWILGRLERPQIARTALIASAERLRGRRVASLSVG